MVQVTRELLHLQLPVPSPSCSTTSCVSHHLVKSASQRRPDEGISAMTTPVTVGVLLHGGTDASFCIPVCVQICVEGPSKRLLTDLIGNGGGALPSGAWLRRPHKRKGRKLYTASQCSVAKYRVKRGDFCASIISKYEGGSVPTFQKMNRGFICKNDDLYVGQNLCSLVPG